ncbi:MAG: sulfate adenylyltransferase [SAR324 cluster bacterium]|jgi:sulfate adenylyltransferase|uniref:sulfate adenylyltransferase n=1 Tax=marine metagenome TaxID=408172 RepID=A0A381NI76_9ZZZZ|nr:sulfate adenylyltransferase [SAR324 cluster bacterium]HBR59463.1 sulfate adenylyltransferase [Deltaproteobacteria bacterium]
MIKPYGSEILNPLFVKDEAYRKMQLEEAEKIPSVVVSSAAAANAVMLGGGYFNPLNAYMNLADVMAVAEGMQMPSGLMWPTPVVNLLEGDALSKELKAAPKIALRDPNVEGNPVIAIQTVDKIEQMSAEQISTVCTQIYGTSSTEHPGVAAFVYAGDTLISGTVEVLNFSYFSTDFPDTFRTAVEIRNEIKERGWETVIAFQTRNPMHRAHEELCRMAQKELNADGILVHMLLGKLKKGDIPAEVRNASIRKMVELYFPENTVMVTGYGFDMLYAGPREAVLHAIFRQNSGCSHLIVGRDHAGVGDYYGAFDAQTIFDKIPEGALQIEIFLGDHTVWCNKCEKVVMMRDCPHGKEDYLLLSGTRVREILAKGEALPPEFSRPEVAKILSEYYQTL